MASQHIPVLVEELITNLQPKGEDRLLDGTLGLGGHTAAYLKAGGEKTTAVGIEADERALTAAKENLAAFGKRVSYVHGNYVQIKDFITGGGILYPPMFSHIVLDLGIGSHQLADESRGFSFRSEGELKMGYGPLEGLPPSSIRALNVLSERQGHNPEADEIMEFLNEKELQEIIWNYGEEKYAGRIASAIVERRQMQSIQSATTLAEIIANAVPTGYEHGRIHPATRTFQALRLAVNRELETIEAAIPMLIDTLAPNGKIAIISFHSLEDRIVKNIFRAEAKGCVCPPEVPTCICGKKPRVTVVNKKPITASDSEINTNPRSRSAKLRIAQRLAPP